MEESNEEYANLVLRVVSATSLPAADIGGTSDPYATIFRVHRGRGIGGAEPLDERGVRIRKMVQGDPTAESANATTVLKKELNPCWNEEFALALPFKPTPLDGLIVKVFDWNKVFKHKLLGVVYFSLADLKEGDTTTRQLELDELERGSVVVGDSKVTLAVTPSNFSVGPIPEGEEKPWHVDKSVALREALTGRKWTMRDAQNNNFSTNPRHQFGFGDHDNDFTLLDLLL